MATTRQPCQFHVLNQCTKGPEFCAFNHDPTICRPGGSGRLCRNFSAAGVCKYGRMCVHLHQLTAGQKQEAAYYYGEQSAANQGEEIVGMYGEAPGTTLGGSAKPTAAPPSSWAKVARLPHQQQLDQQSYIDSTKATPSNTTGATNQWATLAKASHTNIAMPLIDHTASNQSAVSGMQLSRNDKNSTTTTTQPKPRLAAPCKFYFTSGCRAGENCRFSHAAQTGGDTIEGESAQSTCGICFEKLNSKRIGILTHCDHVFCLSCIRGWRTSEMSEVERTKENVQTCPVCRVRSFFVVPSDVIPVSAQEKQKLIDDHCEKCKKIPCKYGDNDCPFGTSCMFYHSIVDPAKLGLRFAKTVEGGDRALTSSVATLGDFILQ